jgi:hypothetical protein
MFRVYYNHYANTIWHGSTNIRPMIDDEMILNGKKYKVIRVEYQPDADYNEMTAYMVIA